MSRIQSIDALKAIAIFAVICLHAVQPRDAQEISRLWEVIILICRFAVPTFFLISGFFFLRAYHASSGELSQLMGYGKRLAKPFFFWAFFYALIPPFIGGTHGSIGHTIMENLTNMVHYPHSFLLTGNVYHLWFISSLLQAACVVWFCLRFLSLRFAIVLGLLFYGIALSGGSYAESPVGFHTRFDVKNGPFVSTLYFSLGAWLGEYSPKVRMISAWWLLIGGALMHIAEALLLHRFFGRSLAGYSFLIGTIPFALGLVMLALSQPNLGARAADLGRYSLGIYLLHPFIITSFVLLPSLDQVYRLSFVFSCIIFGVSLITVACLSKFRWARPVMI